MDGWPSGHNLPALATLRDAAEQVRLVYLRCSAVGNGFNAIVVARLLTPVCLGKGHAASVTSLWQE